jgi:hypothetical protein
MTDKSPQQYWNDKFAATDELIYTDTVNRFVKEYCEGLPKGKMIDLAGGEGRNAIFFAEKGWQVENIDISSVGLTKFLKFAEERGVSEKVFANCADATGFESVLTPVDLGVVAYLQIEVNDLADALDCLIENIRKGGSALRRMALAREPIQRLFGPAKPRPARRHRRDSRNHGRPASRDRGARKPRGSDSNQGWPKALNHPGSESAEAIV